MASKTISLSLSLLMFFLCADGRSLQKNYADKSVDLSHGFSLQATNNTGKTNDNDASGLLEIITQLQLGTDGGDPCHLPRWTWIECNSDSRPRIVALNLRNQLLHGVIPDFSSMDALQRIDLSMNMLSGSIPSFLGTFPDLQKLDLRSNYLSGLIPYSLACKKNKKLNFTVDLSANLYMPDTCSTSNNNPSPSTSNNEPSPLATIASTSTKKKKKKRSRLPAILGSTISSFGVFSIALGIFMSYRHKNKTVAAIAETSVGIS